MVGLRRWPWNQVWPMARIFRQAINRMQMKEQREAGVDEQCRVA